MTLRVKPSGSDRQGYVVSDSELRIQGIARANGREPAALTIQCGIDGCAACFEGEPRHVFAARDAHRATTHPNFKPMRKPPHKLVKPSWDKQEEARARGTQNSRGEHGAPVVTNQEGC